MRSLRLRQSACIEGVNALATLASQRMLVGKLRPLGPITGNKQKTKP